MKPEIRKLAWALLVASALTLLLIEKAIYLINGYPCP